MNEINRSPYPHTAYFFFVEKQIINCINRSSKMYISGNAETKNKERIEITCMNVCVCGGAGVRGFHLRYGG